MTIMSELAPDFRLLDTWELPIAGGRDDFGSALEVFASFDPARMESSAARALFALRFRLGRWLGWDAPKRRSIPGSWETTLSIRLPERLRGSATPVVSDALRRAGAHFVPLYRTDDEWAAELSNGTVHGVLHVAWVADGDGRYHARMAVYVKPRGRLGTLYMTLIQPFRHLVVYPALLRHIGRAWEARALSEHRAIVRP